MTQFSWNNPHTGDIIEQFFLDLCEFVPSLANDLLHARIGPLNSWLSNRGESSYQSLYTADCGCVIGTLALKAKTYKIIKDSHLLERDAYIKFDAVEFLSCAIQNLCYYAPRSLYSTLNITSVGSLIAVEARVSPKLERQRDIIKYIKDFVRCVLTDMGYL